MSKLRIIEIDGRHYLWRDILELRREQRRAHAAAQQPVLFEVKLDHRLPAARSATGRDLEPSLFDARSSV
jgi:hypothetical protein